VTARAAYREGDASLDAGDASCVVDVLGAAAAVDAPSPITANTPFLRFIHPQRLRRSRLIKRGDESRVHAKGAGRDAQVLQRMSEVGEPSIAEQLGRMRSPDTHPNAPSLPAANLLQVHEP
jgi:hypothetical protein